MLKDAVCQPACNNLACAYDNGACAQTCLSNSNLVESIASAYRDALTLCGLKGQCGAACAQAWNLFVSFQIDSFSIC
jgi:hypothetical protein